MAFRFEHELVTHFRLNVNSEWAFYPENQSWDFLLMHRETHVQVGVQAKLNLNDKVIWQCVELLSVQRTGPNFAAILVPESELSKRTARKLLQSCAEEKLLVFTEKTIFQTILPEWEPLRCIFEGPVWTPPYEPDMLAGVKSPKPITPFKVAAVRLCAALRAGFEPTDREIKEMGAGSVRYWERWLEPTKGRPRKWRLVRSDDLPDKTDFKDVAEALRKVPLKRFED